MPNQPTTTTKASQVQMPNIPQLQQTLVPQMGPIPTLQAPNVNIQLPKPPSMPPK
jgi:hypothetical protein